MLLWSSAAMAAAAAPVAASSTAPLQANGLTAQLLKQVGRWVDGLSDQLLRTGRTLQQLPHFFVWSEQTFRTPAAQATLVQALGALLAVFVAGLLVEWLMRRVLRRPRRGLIEHAERSERQARDKAAREARTLHAQQLAQNEAAKAAKAALDAQASEAAERGAASGGGGTTVSAAKRAATTKVVPPAPVTAGQSDVALMRTQLPDGTERVEAVPVDAGDGASGNAGDEARAAASEDAERDVEASEEALATAPVAQSTRHWATLRHIPYALGTLALDLIPIGFFFITAGLVLRWLAGDDGPVQEMTSGFIDAYLTTTITMAVVRLLVLPAGHGFRLLNVGPTLSRTVELWVRRIIVLASFGVAIMKGAAAFGADTDAQIAFMKIVSLLVHTSAVILIFRLRVPLGTQIAAGPGKTGAIASVRNWLGDVWAFFASFVVIAIWVVWALGVQNGFPKLVHFIAVTTAVLIGARVIAVIALGAVGRAFQINAAADAEDGSPAPQRGRIAQRYYSAVRWVVSALIVVGAIIGLLEVWGVHAIAWFTRGSIGRDLASAAGTIAIAAVVAIVVWEAANAAVERRMTRWTERGDLVSAARLRTLLPMLRTCLFITIALIVGLTALNEIGINTTPLLASASIIGVALGFGSQKLVQDFITGIFLLMENAMQVGDWVTVAGVSGSVEYLSIRTVRLRAGDGSLHIVPFSSVSTVNNTNRGIGNAAVRVSVSYDSNIDQVIDELKQIGAGIRSDPAFADLTLNDLELWGVDSVDGSMVTIAGQIRCIDKGRWGVQRAFNRRMFERFRELGIEIANPRASLLLPSGALDGARSPLGPPAAPGSMSHQEPST